MKVKISSFHSCTTFAFQVSIIQAHSFNKHLPWKSLMIKIPSICFNNGVLILISKEMFKTTVCPSDICAKNGKHLSRVDVPTVTSSTTSATVSSWDSFRHTSRTLRWSTSEVSDKSITWIPLKTLIIVVRIFWQQYSVIGSDRQQMGIVLNKPPYPSQECIWPARLSVGLKQRKGIHLL